MCYRDTGFGIVTHTAPSWSGWSETCAPSGPWRSSNSNLVSNRAPLPAVSRYRRREAFWACMPYIAGSQCTPIGSVCLQRLSEQKWQFQRKSHTPNISFPLAFSSRICRSWLGQSQSIQTRSPSCRAPTENTVFSVSFRGWLVRSV